MKQFNKEEYNNLCAKFMEIEYYEIYGRELSTSRLESEFMCVYANTQYECSRDDFPFLLPMDYLKFGTDWNWIMEVVKKIESYSWKKSDEYIYNPYMLDINSCLLKCDKEGLIQAIWEFLNWYNEQIK